MIELLGFETLDPKREQKLNDSWHRVLARREVGFPRLPERSEDWLAIEKRVHDAGRSSCVVVIGIGGSSLGTQVLTQCFQETPRVPVIFLESPDPHSWARLQALPAEQWRHKHVVVVSKSGNTLETLSWVEALAAREPDWLKTSPCTVVASPGEGPLQKWAKREGVPTLWIPTEVGGRFSVLTAVSMLPAGLMGLHVQKFRTGAAWALANPKLATILSGQVLAAWDREEWITQLWTYSESLRVFGEWWQQLWGESLAKKLTRAGASAPRASTPMACSGPRDQHSLVQQLIEGARDKHIFLTRVKSVEQSREKFRPRLFPEMPFSGREIALGQILGAEAEAFAQSLKECAIQATTVQLETIDEASLGALFMLWQMVIAQLGEFMGIDAFNQPGVELGKKYAAKLLHD